MSTKTVAPSKSTKVEKKASEKRAPVRPGGSGDPDRFRWK